MKQIIQSYRSGQLTLTDVPVPSPKPGQVLVHSRVSLVSVGTEKYMLDLAQKSLLGKALARPDWVRQVADKVRTEGILEAYRQASARLDTPVPLGYSVAGRVVEVNHNVTAFRVGDRVACAGTGFASHAEYVTVPENLCVYLPETVDYEAGAFVALGAIALHSVRTADAQIGQRLAVIGLGLLGQIVTQIAIAAGCRVVGMDLKPIRCRLAEEHGAEATATKAEEFAALCLRLSEGLGVDAVLISAHTDSNEPIELSARICRERGSIVAVGTVGLDIPRKPFFEKELDFVVSRAWGPGAFDTDFEERNVKYPLPYVRWTAQTNMEEFLRLVAKGQVRLDRVITHRFPIEAAQEAYNLILGQTEEPFLGVLLTYRDQPELQWRIDIRPELRAQSSRQQQKIRLSFIGAGLYARGTLLPAMNRLSNVEYRGVVTSSGISSRHIADKYGFAYCTSDYHQVLDDPDTDVVFILTRHGSHAHFVTEALKAGKHVFVEKPLALNPEQLRDVVDTYNLQRANPQPLLMVGFNRRFSPFTVQAKEWLTPRSEPLVINCRVNAGFVPADSWVHDPVEGGGRIIGEVCHFVDLIQYLTDSVPVRVYAEAISGDGAYFPDDNVVITLKLADGSVATITYTAAGDRAFPRERIEVFGGGAACAIDNFKSITFTKAGNRKSRRSLLSLDRGHKAELETFFTAIQNDGPPPVDFTEYIYTTLTTFAIEESLRKGESVTVDLGVLQPVEKGKSEEDKKAKGQGVD